MIGIRGAIVAGGLLLALAGFLLSFGGQVTLSPPALIATFQLPSLVLWGAGFAIGIVLACAVLWAPADEATARALGSTAVLTITTFGLAVLMIVAASLNQAEMPPSRAGLVFILGTLALLAAVRTLELLRADKPIQFESNWGGLGGGMGGWRLSSAAAFAVLAIIFASATVTVALVGPARPSPTGGANNQLANAAATNGSSTNSAANQAEASAAEANVAANNASTAAVNSGAAQ